jgi:hypothetical protein
MRKFTTCLFTLLFYCFIIDAQNQVVYSADEFRTNPPEMFDERVYESEGVNSPSAEVDRRRVEESGNIKYAFVRFSNNFNFRPVELALESRMTVSIYLGQSGDVRYVVYRVREYEMTDKSLKTREVELPQSADNKFRRIFGEFAKQYKSSYKSLKPFKVFFSVDLKKDKRNLDKSALNTLEEALTNARPDTVKELNLSGLELKEVPEVIYRFKNLEQLELSNNYLTSIPEELTKLKKLKYLGLDFNDLTNNSVAFARNRNLKVLRLQHNPITTLPESIRKNRRVEDLLLGNNKLSNLNMASFRGLRKLRTLNLYNVQIEELSENVKLLRRLEIIDLYHNDLRYLPKKIYKLKRLKTLAVSHNRLWKLPEKLYKLEKLKDFYVHHNKLSTLPELPQNVVLLHFNNNRFKDLPQSITKLPNLGSIDFSSNEIERLPIELLSFPKLKNVYMMGNEYNRKKELFDDVDRFIVDLERRKITVR